METERTIYRGEVVPLSYTITDRLENAFVPDNAYVYIYNESETLMATETATVDANTMSMVTTGSVFSTVGKYKLVWEILQNPYKFYHVTNLTVENW